MKKLSSSYVSRGGLKIASIAEKLKLNFNDKIVVDVGSSTGGFTDFALRNRAQKVIAIDLGSHQLHESLRNNPRVELHEQLDIRDVKSFSTTPDIILVDVNFVSLRDILPYIAQLIEKQADIVALLKPQFETGSEKIKNRGIIKNDRLRRAIIKEFERWARQRFVLVGKADSKLAGLHGNIERFYKLRKV